MLTPLRALVLGAVVLLLVVSACSSDGVRATSTSARAAAPTHEATVSGGATGVGELVVDRDIPYGPDDRHRLDVYRHDNLNDAPTILVVHGSGWAFGDKRDVADLASLFAERGFIAVAPNYRRVGSNGENAFPVPANDVACAAAWLTMHADQYGGDASTMVATGYSAGGHLAAMLAYDAQRDWLDKDCPNPGGNQEFVAYIGFSTPYDLRLIPPMSPEVCRMLKDVVGGEGTECFEADPDLFKPANPVDQATSDDPPSLVITGDLDCKQSFPPDPETGHCTASPDAFVAALENAAVPVDLIVLRGVMHEIDYDDETVRQAIDTFLQHHQLTERS